MDEIHVLIDKIPLAIAILAKEKKDSSKSTIQFFNESFAHLFTKCNELDTDEDSPPTTEQMNSFLQAEIFLPMQDSDDKFKSLHEVINDEGIRYFKMISGQEE